MNNNPFYYILTFPTTAAVMEAEAYIKKYFLITIMPIPHEISAGCGLAIRFMNSITEENAITEFCRLSPCRGTLYKMHTRKMNGCHLIEKIL